MSGLNQEVTIGDLWENVPAGLKNFLVFVLRTNRSITDKYKDMDVSTLPFVPLQDLIPILSAYKEVTDNAFDKVAINAACLEIDRALAILLGVVDQRIAELKKEVTECL